MKTLSLVFALASLAGSVSAEESPSPALNFYRSAWTAHFHCENAASNQELRRRLYGTASNDEVATCITSGEGELKTAFASLDASKPDAQLRAAAKDWYAAELAYFDMLLSVHARPAADTTEASAARKAEANFKIEAGL